jgi:hypothetical protein
VFSDNLLRFSPFLAVFSESFCKKFCSSRSNKRIVLNPPCKTGSWGQSGHSQPVLKKLVSLYNLLVSDPPGLYQTV